MGGYLSGPITDKESADYEGERLICGASSMQGWRATQEDAHNCFIKYDENSSLFAVYDGHGGHEVAEYAAKHLPDFIKETDAYKNGDYEKALIDSFLGFDETLATPKVISILKRIAGTKEDKKDSDVDGADKQNEGEDDEEDEDDEENLEHLCKEAHMPLEQLIDKYRKESSGRFKFNSPNLRTRKAANSSGASTSSSSCISSSEANADDGEVSSSSSMQNSESKTNLTNGEVDVNGDINDEVVNGETSSEPGSSSDKCNGSTSDNKTSVDASSSSSGSGSTDNKADLPDSSSQSQNEEKNVSSSNGEISNTTNDESNKISSSSPEKKDLIKRVTLTRKLLCSPGEDDSDTDSEDDETFEGGAADSSEEEEGAEEGEGEEDEDDEDEDEDEDYVEDEDFGMQHRDEPGSDSGCTAVVALLKGNDLFVANAGDSRCVVCRDGQAVEMSIDHKPEDKIEMDRIFAAGGKVSRDGRINGGLNLSRALGDHTYKQVKTLPATEQMITALPDVKKLEIDNSKDEFIVLACDGIWNFMSSQDVVDFIRPRLNEKREKISSICEELFDHCLAPDTLGDGTGCDNMTCIIVQLKRDGINGHHDSIKRSASSLDEPVEDDKSENNEENVSAKRQKLNDDVTPPVSVSSN